MQGATSPTSDYLGVTVANPQVQAPDGYTKCDVSDISKLLARNQRKDGRILVGEMQDARCDVSDINKLLASYK